MVMNRVIAFVRQDPKTSPRKQLLRRRADSANYESWRYRTRDNRPRRNCPFLPGCARPAHACDGRIPCPAPPSASSMHPTGPGMPGTELASRSSVPVGSDTRSGSRGSRGRGRTASPTRGRGMFRTAGNSTRAYSSGSSSPPIPARYGRRIAPGAPCPRARVGCDRN